MTDTQPRYGLRLTKARVQRMQAHATYQPQTMLALEERQPLSQSPTIQALAEQRELAGLSPDSKAEVRISATGEGVHIIFNEDDAPKPTRPRPRRADPATRAARQLSTIRRMSSIPHIQVTEATPKTTPQNSMTGSMVLRSAGVAAVVAKLPKQAFLTPKKYTPTFRRKTPNAPVKKVKGRATPAPRARSPSPDIVREPLSRTPSISPFLTSSPNVTTKKTLFPKLDEVPNRRKSARLTIQSAQSNVAGICQAQHHQGVVEQVAVRQMNRKSRSPSESPEETQRRLTRAGGTPGPDFSIMDDAWSTQPHYQDLNRFFVNNNAQAGPSRQRGVRFELPTPQPRFGIIDPTPTISLADRRAIAARRASGAQGLVWATNDGHILVGPDGLPEQPQPEEIRPVQTAGLGPNGTEQFEPFGKRVFVTKEVVQRGPNWYFPTSAGLPTLEEE